MADKSSREYPAMVYSSDQQKVVNSAAEFDALEGKWYDSPADVPELQETAHPVTGQVTHPAAESIAAPAPVKALPAPLGPNPTTRDHLLFEAETIGLVVDKRWKDERLRREIQEFASQ